jgi:hypothetical protein
LFSSLKHRLIEWLGLATKDEVQHAHDHAVHFVLSKVSEAVKQELDRDERTIVFNPSVNITVDEARIQRILQDKLVEAVRPGGILRR